MPEGCNVSFMAWWKLLDNSSTVTVQYPHERHGLAGSISHAAKVDAKQDFLNFVDINSQPNGRSAESSKKRTTKVYHIKLLSICVAKKGKTKTCHISTQIGLL